MSDSAAEIQCPGCKGVNLRRSHRTGVAERFLGLFGRYAYRCRDCQARFLIGAKKHSAPPSARRVERRQADARRKVQLMLLFAAGLAVFLIFAWKVILAPPAQ